MGLYSIKDLENLTGIKAHTIRIWEKRYGLLRPMRTDTNIRFYCDENLKRILNISILNRHGFRISKIAHLSEGEMNEMVLQLTQQKGDYDSQVESLVISTVDMDEPMFERLISRAIMQEGYENTFINILYPFFEKVGYLWQTGAIKPVQEHFVSHLVRQKLIVAIDGLIPRPVEGSRTFLLFLPENEYHELGLLFYSYLIRKMGHRVIYLGQSVPFGDLEEVMDRKSVDSMVTSFTTGLQEISPGAYLSKLSRAFPSVRIYVTGLYLKGNMLKVNRGVKVFTGPGHLYKILAHKPVKT